MTVAALPSVVSYVENGATTAFAAPFRFKSPVHLNVVRKDLSGLSTVLRLGLDYPVTGGSTDSGGTVTIATPVAGATLEIRRRTPRTQPMVYTTNDRFPAKSHEGAIDNGVRMIQEVDDDLAAVARDVERLKASTEQIVFDPGVDPPDSDAFFDPGPDPMANTLKYDPGEN